MHPADDLLSPNGHPPAGTLATPAEIGRRLNEHRTALIDAWLRAVVPIAATVYGSRELRISITKLTDRLLPAMALGDQQAQAEARQAGADLADLLYMDGDGLARSHMVLADTVIHTIPGEWHEARRAATSALVALIAGFQERSRAIILNEQEGIHQALLTSLRQARKDLEDSQARFQSLFLESGICMWVGDLTGQTLETNPALRALLGLTEQEFYTANVSELVHEADRPRVALLWQQLVDGQIESFQEAIRWRHRRGHTVWGNLTLSLVRNAGGCAEYLVAILQDISDQERAAEALRQADDRVHALVENSADFIAVVDGWGDFTYLSPAVHPILGYEPGELHRTDVWRLIDDEDLLTLRELWEALMASPRLSQYRRIRIRRKDGAWVWIGMTCANRLDDPGIQGIVINGRDVTEQVELDDRLKHIANTDHLTQLSSRLAFMERVGEMLNAERQVAMLVADLDRFKLINDSLGHQAGDEALIALADRFRSCIGPDDMAARLGGDEFAMVLVDADEADARSVAQCLLDAMREPVLLQQRPTVLSTSVGIAISDPGLNDSNTLLSAADLALYRAKESGRAKLAVYEPAMRSAAVRRLELEGGLRAALPHGELFLAYQPEIDLRTGETVGVEALVRWERPGDGPVAPDEFVAIAEETGLVIPIGQWVRNEACQQIRRWRDAGLRAGTFEVSVNISGRELGTDGLVASVADCLQTSGLEPHQLCLEISERVLISELIAATPVLVALRDLGVRIAIDDFGAGQTSIAALPRIGADMLKIDRALIAPADGTPPDPMIIKVIASLAHTLGMRVCAEGIETAAQHSMVRATGCDRGQGYHYLPPLSPDDIIAWLVRPS